MEYNNIEEHILNTIKNEVHIIVHKDVRPLIYFFYNVYIKLTEAGFKLPHNVIIKNEPETLITQLSDYSILENYHLEEKNYIKALFVLYVSNEEIILK